VHVLPGQEDRDPLLVDAPQMLPRPPMMAALNRTTPR
jgi:hypothetical protein